MASATNELRWLKEFVSEQQHQSPHQHPPRHHHSKPLDSQQKLRSLCVARARGKPLQYIMGTEYFGDLEISCKPGVLIPRQETAASVIHLVERLHGGKAVLPKHLKLLDLCTGTGCISLLARHEFNQRKPHTSRDKRELQVVGVDISPKAIKLARENLAKIVKDGTLPSSSAASLNPSVHFIQADILAEDEEASSKRSNQDANTLPSLTTALQHYHEQTSTPNKTKHPSRWDMVISNPPYISPSAFLSTTTRSVKRYEPKLALVPPPPSTMTLNEEKDTNSTIDPGDLFYPRLLHIAKQVEAQVVLFEVADMEQASRVAVMAREQGVWTGIEIWRDDPTCPSDDESDAPKGIKMVGKGNGRSVFAYREDAATWLS